MFEEYCVKVTICQDLKFALFAGNDNRQSRINIWNDKRVFFITPQILQNDLDVMPNLGKQIKCLVIDEAHKAKGNHSYCEIIKKLYVMNKHFRVLALSATPGKDEHEMAQVCYCYFNN